MGGPLSRRCRSPQHIDRGRRQFVPEVPSDKGGRRRSRAAQAKGGRKKRGIFGCKIVQYGVKAN